MTPFFIAYPRSGNHWIKSVTCAYFDKSKIKYDPSMTYSSVAENVLFFGGHELLELPEEARILYLYRNPEDVLFSVLKVERRGNIHHEAAQLKDHLCRFLLRDNTACIKYERFQENFVKEFAKVVRFFDESHVLNKRRAVMLNRQFSKANIVGAKNNKYMNRSLLSNEYQHERDVFRQKNATMIRGLVIVDELSKYFKDTNENTR